MCSPAMEVNKNHGVHLKLKSYGFCAQMQSQKHWAFLDDPTYLDEAIPLHQEPTEPLKVMVKQPCKPAAGNTPPGQKL